MQVRNNRKRVALTQTSEGFPGQKSTNLKRILCKYHLGPQFLRENTKPQLGKPRLEIEISS